MSTTSDITRAYATEIPKKIMEIIGKRRTRRIRRKKSSQIGSLREMNVKRKTEKKKMRTKCGVYISGLCFSLLFAAVH